jgi:GPH family glycoside/pentoside/hexuronide:cation symporter
VIFLKKDNSSKVGAKVMLGYAMGAMPDSAAYNLFYVYFLYFITDLVGLSPFLAGAISLIVIIWDAISDPIVGYLSDNWKSKRGRRRPFMIFALVPLALTMTFIFLAVDFGTGLTFLYYVIMGILYWTSYKIFVIPYYALGAEITNDFNERTNLRGASGFIMYLAMWLVSAGPMVMIDRLSVAGYAETTGWTIAGLILGIISLIFGLWCWWSTKGRELVDTKADFQFEENARIIHNYIELFKLKAIRLFLLMTLIYNIAFAIALAAFVFIMDNNLGLTELQQAFYWTCYAIITIIFVPVCNLVANKIGKKNAMIYTTLVAIAGCFIFFATGIHSFTQLLFFTALYNFGNVCYWTVGYSLMYDCTEIDEYANDKRREGAITGFSSFMQKFGGAVGMYITGSLLGLFGYDGTIGDQSPIALQGIITVNTLIPGIIMIIGTIFIILYPINKTRYNKLVDVIARKKAGEPYDEDEDIKKLY